jgi:hypothetical protein
MHACYIFHFSNNAYYKSLYYVSRYYLRKDCILRNQFMIIMDFHPCVVTANTTAALIFIFYCGREGKSVY